MHCFRRSSASLLADCGVDISVLKRHGGWTSDKMANGYVEHSENNKRKISEDILGKKSARLDATSSSSSAPISTSQQLLPFHMKY